MSRGYTGVVDAGLLLLFCFIISHMIMSPLFIRSGNPAATLSIVEYCINLLLILSYIVVSVLIMFRSNEFRRRRYSFWHGGLIGMSYPLSLFLVGESVSWCSFPSTFAATSSLAAIMGGMLFCGTFVFWILLSRPSMTKRLLHSAWFDEDRPIVDRTVIGLWTLSILGAAVSMLCLSQEDLAGPGFTIAINTFVYMSVLAYALWIRMSTRSTHLSLGTLFGAAFVIMLMALKWTFHFASRHELFAKTEWEHVSMAALTLNAGMAVLTVPLLATWPKKEAQVEQAAMGRRDDVNSLNSEVRSSHGRPSMAAG